MPQIVKKIQKQIQKINRMGKKMNTPAMWKKTAITLAAIIILSRLFDISVTPKIPIMQKGIKQGKTEQTSAESQIESEQVNVTALTQSVLPEEGVTLPVVWADAGKRMVADGVIDEQKFRALFQGGLTNTEEQMLSGRVDEPVVLNQKNSRYLLDVLWAFGLANKNAILEKGEMADKQYGGAGNFASTGGWSLAKGAGFDHYSKHTYVTLTDEQQELVERVSRGIYRPCCGNSTHFPDCNHGMAMLGLLELMAKNGVSEQEMYDVALRVNAFWFPQTYIDLAMYFKEQGKEWNEIDAKTVLGAEFSSAQGYQKTRQQIQSLPKPASGGGGCGA